MRALAGVIGIVFWAGGIIMICAVVLGEARGSGALLALGAALLITGVIISRSATHKTCPQCAERVRYEALKCKHCGHEFASKTASTTSEPFYK